MRLNEELERSRLHASLFGVLVIRLERYRALMESLGQRAAEHYIVANARRLTNCAPERALVACLERSEFAMLIYDIDGLSEAIAVAQTTFKELGVTIEIEGHEITGKIQKIGRASCRERV